MNMKTVLLFSALLLAGSFGVTNAQVADAYATVAIHSHNDYEHSLPLYEAYSAHSNSIEADIFLADGQLCVAHVKEDVKPERTLTELYLEPIRRQMKLNGGSLYGDDTQVQLLIDLKTDYKTTLPALEKVLKKYRDCFDPSVNKNAVRIVISGHRPAPADFGKYDSMLLFDGDLTTDYSGENGARVPMVSVPFFKLSVWNGLGRMVEDEYAKVKDVIDRVHAAGKKVRFWGCPDTKTAWNTFMNMGVDYLNTDNPGDLRDFLELYPKNNYSTEGKFHEIYRPTYEPDRSDDAPRNVIVLISDGGAGQAQMWSAATANGGNLNLLQMKTIGLIKNNPTNDYTTDSAASGTALATGRKTRNRRIGTDELGNRIDNITEVLSGRGYSTGIVSNDNITGATPSAYYAHQPERDMSDEIAKDLLNTPASIVIGGAVKTFAEQDSLLVRQLRDKGVAFVNGVESLSAVPGGQRVVCVAQDDYKSDRRVIEEAFDEVIGRLSENEKGFFVMFEGAKVDKGGHANDVKTVIDEYLSFDRMVGKALEFADKDKNTLVLVLSDHETGGMTIINGDYATGAVTSSFSTPDHTGIPVLLYAYGPGSRLFAGFAENTSIFEKITSLLK